MFKKILVATDGSDNANEAVRHAAQLAKIASTDTVLVLHVCPACTADIDLQDTNRKIAERILEDAGSIVSVKETDVQLMIEADYPPESVGLAITDIAKERKVDLIILGSRGLSEVKGLLLGSVSNKVLQHAECPVLVVKS
ncbi:MAG: universal stress protein [Actinomycetota bacterium]